MKMPELPDLPSFDDLKPDEEFMRSVIRGYALAYGERVREACAKQVEECAWPKWAESTDTREVFASAIRGEEK